ncbi:MAG: DNA polymerase clamp loader subunit A [archaeon]
MANKKDNSLFDAINSINDKKKREINFKKANGFILSLWLAQDKYLIKQVNRINPYIHILPNKAIFKYYLKATPKKKRYIRWTKKEKIDKERQEKIDELCLKYNISPREAKLSL